MAAAEARAVWQRTVHRCLLQEDAKRAPKLACCPSTSPCSKEADIAPQYDADGQGSPSVGLLPFNWNPSYYSLSPNSRWWMHPQPSYRRITSEQLNCEESEMKISQSPEVKSLDESTKSDSFVNSDVQTSASDLKNDVGSEKLESKCSHKGSVFGDDSAVSKEDDEMFSWIGDGKTEPWWRITDEDELALLVAQRSFGMIENCDLPQPQISSSAKSKSFLDPISIDYDKTGAAPKHPSYGVSSTSTHSTTRDRRAVEESESSKAELLEALRHSQTRAREAEKAAKEAYEEKEHVVKLVFRQASQLFAYKQWFQLLQIENLLSQVKNDKEHPSTGLFPLPVPWMPQKPRRVRKNWQKESIGKGKRGKKAGNSNHNICRYAVVFALGLSLVGAGLFLGWSVGGWMLPTF